jgi:hypothetical protein
MDALYGQCNKNTRDWIVALGGTDACITPIDSIALNESICWEDGITALFS